MNLFIFLLIWAFIWYIPIPPKKTSLKKPGRIVSLLIGLLLFFIIQFEQPPLSVFVYLLIFLRLFAAFFESALSIKPAAEFKHTERHYCHQRFQWKLSPKLNAKTVGILFIIYVLAASTMIVFGSFKGWQMPITLTVLFKRKWAYRLKRLFQTTWCVLSQRSLPYQ